MAATVILDIDGTLVDSNYQHALAWHRALRSHGHTVQMWKVHRHIGMGGDQILDALIGEQAAAERGDQIRETEAEAYEELIGEVEAMEGARELVEALCADEGVRVVLASSAKEGEVSHYLDLLGVRDVVDAWTTSADVERTKPAADLVHAALDKADADGPALMIGDSVWDVKAARSAGVPTLAVLTGGFSDSELIDAGAVRVVREITSIREDLPSVLRLARDPHR